MENRTGDVSLSPIDIFTLPWTDSDTLNIYVACSVAGNVAMKVRSIIQRRKEKAEKKANKQSRGRSGSSSREGLRRHARARTAPSPTKLIANILLAVLFSVFSSFVIGKAVDSDAHPMSVALKQRVAAERFQRGTVFSVL